MNYLMLAFAAVLNSFDFVISKLYQKRVGSTLRSGFVFNGLVGAFSAVIFFCINGFKLDISWYSCIWALIMTAVAVVYIILGFKILSESKMAYYTFYRMTGTMLLPYLWGLLMLQESFSVLEMIGLAVMVAAVMIMNLDGQRLSFKHTALCLAVFVLAGCTGIISKEHALSPSAVSPVDYIILTSLAKILLCGGYLCLPDRKEHSTASQNPMRGKVRKALWFLGIFGGSALITGISYMLQLVCAENVPATVLYPLITGGTVVFTAVTARIFFGEKFTAKSTVAIILCVVGTCLFL